MSAFLKELLSLPTGIPTRSGRVIDLLNPRPYDIDPRDIAYSLARIIRFGGHSPGWNVALHSVQVSRFCPSLFRLEGLLHDAAEAYVGDVTRPLKTLLGQAYRDIEVRFERVIAERFGLSYPWPNIVKQIDNKVCRLELNEFWPSKPTRRQPLSHSDSETLFLAELHALLAKRAA